MSIGGKYPSKTFYSKDDIMEVVDLLVEETRVNNKANNFDVAYSVAQQLSFFCCKNHFLDKEYQDDIKRYMYCKDYSIPAYPGSYNDQPKIWIDKSNVISHAVNISEKNAIKNASKKVKG